MPPPEGEPAAAILGIDPGLKVLGYGLIQEAEGQLRVRAYGVIVPPRRADLPQRLWALHEGVRRLIEVHRPTEIALEDFVVGHVRAAVALGEARAVAMLAAAQAGLSVQLYQPAEVKQFVASYGRGGKGQVQGMVRLLLGMEELPQPQDAADALAIALCHYFHRQARRLVAGHRLGSSAAGDARIEEAVPGGPADRPSTPASAG